MDDFNKIAPTWDEKSYRTERANAIAQCIRAGVPLSSRMTALEYGCGTGLLSFALQPDLGQIILADNSPGMLSVLAEKITASGVANMTPFQVDLVSGPLPSVRVNLIYTLMTLHHIEDTAQILRTFFAMLEPNGYLCVADLDMEDGSFHGPGFTGHQGFDRIALGGLVKQTGFRTVTFNTAFQTPHQAGAETRYYPVFLMVAEK